MSFIFLVYLDCGLIPKRISSSKDGAKVAHRSLKLIYLISNIKQDSLLLMPFFLMPYFGGNQCRLLERVLVKSTINMFHI